MAKNGSRYILGHLGYSDYASLKEGQEAVIVLNPEEPKARFEASKSLKAAFAKVQRRCVIRTQMILVEVEAEPGTWKQGHLLTVKPVAQTASNDE